MGDKVPEGMIDAGLKESVEKKKQSKGEKGPVRRSRGVRGGKKFSEKKKRMEKLIKKQMVKSIVNDSGVSLKLIPYN